MTIDIETAIFRIQCHIANMRKAPSLRCCQRQHAEAAGYTQALLEFSLIDLDQWEAFANQADTALATWMPLAVYPVSMLGWQPKDYE